MVLARLFCSGGRCPAVFEALGPLEEIDALACDCGCALQVVGWPEPIDAASRQVMLLELAA